MRTRLPSGMKRAFNNSFGTNRLSAPAMSSNPSPCDSIGPAAIQDSLALNDAGVRWPIPNPWMVRLTAPLSLGRVMRCAFRSLFGWDISSDHFE
jgi:hypothetical protein